MLRELWTAREDKARELDRTPSKVLSHQALVAAAVARPTSRKKMQSLREFSSRQARQNQELWWQAIDRALRLPESDLPPAHAPLGEGELPQPRSWPRRHAEAATALEEVRAAVRERAAQLRLPQELLLSPDVQRHLAWQIGEQEAAGHAPDVSVRALSETLAELGARPWQIEQSAQTLSQVLA